MKSKLRKDKHPQDHKCNCIKTSGQSIDNLMEDKKRLDWLDEINSNLNKHQGTKYGWKYDINHNRACLSDHNIPPLSIREAIDQARNKH